MGEKEQARCEHRQRSAGWRQLRWSSPRRTRTTRCRLPRAAARSSTSTTTRMRNPGMMSRKIYLAIFVKMKYKIICPKGFPSYKSFKGSFPTNTVPDTRLRFGNSGSCSRTRLRSYYVSSCDQHMFRQIYFNNGAQCHYLLASTGALTVMMCYQMILKFSLIPECHI